MYRKPSPKRQAAHSAQRRVKERNTPAAIQERNVKAVARSLILVSKAPPPRS